ncbi:hypothetical protein IFM89_011466 [Coptis chinensis]|uniref:Uncharacterized protein n=1 Tax=Coptis chinensis TaxID=261450 RepID=A0A835M9D9_9MAGN|nr:hypothetical protein IFM89_011466 [Coptis chinensis]
MGEDKRNLVSNRNIKKSDIETESLPTREKFEDVRYVPKLHDLLAMENSLKGGGKEIGDPFLSNGINLYEKETKFYTDKSVTECELPELVVCFKEGDYHVVKDIVIDDGLPSLNKFLVDNGEVHNDKFFSSHSGLDVDGDLTKEILGNVPRISNGTNPFIECDDTSDVAKNSCAESFIQNGEENFDETGNVDNAAPTFKGTNPFVERDSKTDAANISGFEDFIEKEEENLDDSLNLKCASPNLNGTNPFLECDGQVDVTEKSGCESMIGNGEGDTDERMSGIFDEKMMPETVLLAQEVDAGNSLEPSNLDGSKNQQQSNQDTSKEHSADSMMPSAAEELNHLNQAEEVPFNNQVEKGSITYDFDSSSPATSGREEDFEKSESVQTLNRPSIEEETLDSRTASSRSFFIQHGYGETSFSAEGPLSGPITYSGPIPYSGSISLRSDSSTTSTRSFAFPILHSEWSSSPVKMAKADKRQFRKQQGWRRSLLCCRF